MKIGEPGESCTRKGTGFKPVGCAVRADPTGSLVPQGRLALPRLTGSRPVPSAVRAKPLRRCRFEIGASAWTPTRNTSFEDSHDCVFTTDANWSARSELHRQSAVSETARYAWFPSRAETGCPGWTRTNTTPFRAEQAAVTSRGTWKFGASDGDCTRMIRFTRPVPDGSATLAWNETGGGRRSCSPIRQADRSVFKTVPARLSGSPSIVGGRSGGVRTHNLPRMRRAHHLVVLRSV